MKTRFVLLASIVVVIIGIVWISERRPAAPNVRIQLSSSPFPMTVGPTTLLVSLNDAGGTPVDGAEVHVSSQINHPGAITLVRYPNKLSSGEYGVPMVWPKMGQWTVNVTVELPDQRGTMQEQFLVFVYAVSPHSRSNQSTYRSVREIDAAVSSNPLRELWIVIPQGTQEMVMEGLREDPIPAEIRLQVKGRNTLVIRNDDLTDHTIGPFFVRAGETIRQEFTQPAIYQGTCSIRQNAEISIVVEA